jgi:hypothetical protein
VFLVAWCCGSVIRMAQDLFTVCGIVGACCFIFAYFAALQELIAPADWRFPALNLAGAVLVLISLYDAWNLPSVILEMFWGAMSLYGLTRNLRRLAWRARGASKGP